MNKLVAVTFFALLSVAYAEVREDVYGLHGHGNLATHTDDYITLNALQYKRVLEGYNTKLDEFTDSFLGRLETVTNTRTLVIKSLIKSYERWDPMLVLSDYTGECVAKYRYNIPTLEVTKAAMTKCHEDYRVQLTTLVTPAVNTRNVLSGYIETYYKEVEKCSKNSTSKSDYTLCVADLTGKITNLVVKNEKTFQVELEAAECTAKAHISSALDCCYSVLVHTQTATTEVEVSIDDCLIGEKECLPCDDYSAAYSHDIKEDVTNETMYNPFYGRSDNAKCIMLNVQK